MIFMKKNSLFLQKRLVFQNKDQAPTEVDMEFTEAEKIAPKNARKELEDKLGGAVKRLEEKIDEMRGEPKYKDMVANADARLNAAKKDMKRLTDTQVTEILSNLRLSVVTANMEEMAAKLKKVVETLDKEKEGKLKAFDDKYNELKKKYAGWPDTLKALEQSYNSRKVTVDGLYMVQRLEAGALYTKTMSELGPDIDDVIAKFKNLGIDYEDILVRKIKELNANADSQINLEGYESGAGQFFYNEMWTSVGTLNSDRVNVLQLELNINTMQRGESGGAETLSKTMEDARALDARIKEEEDDLKSGKYSAEETAKRVAAMHKVYTDEFPGIQEKVEPKVRKGLPPEAVASREARPEGRKAKKA